MTPRANKVLEILQAGESIRPATLAAEFGVAKRTIYRDIKALQKAGHAVVFDEEKNTYTLRSTTSPSPLKVRRAIAVLQAVVQAGGSIRHEELMTATGCSDSSIYRYTDLLRSLGYYIISERKTHTYHSNTTSISPYLAARLSHDEELTPGEEAAVNRSIEEATKKFREERLNRLRNSSWRPDCEQEGSPRIIRQAGWQDGNPVFTCD